MAVDPKDFETKDMRIERLERAVADLARERDALRVIAQSPTSHASATPFA